MLATADQRSPPARPCTTPPLLMPAFSTICASDDRATLARISKKTALFIGSSSCSRTATGCETPARAHGIRRHHRDERYRRDVVSIPCHSYAVHNSEIRPRRQRSAGQKPQGAKISRERKNPVNRQSKDCPPVRGAGQLE